MIDSYGKCGKAETPQERGGSGLAPWKASILKWKSTNRAPFTKIWLLIERLFFSSMKKKRCNSHLFFDYFGMNFSFKSIDMMLTLNRVIKLFENFELVNETKKGTF